MLDLAKTPELAAEVTLQPVNAFALDAAILFSDIMVPLWGIGIPFRIEENVGPIVDQPIRGEDHLPWGVFVQGSDVREIEVVADPGRLASQQLTFDDVASGSVLATTEIGMATMSRFSSSCGSDFVTHMVLACSPSAISSL